MNVCISHPGFFYPYSTGVPQFTLCNTIGLLYHFALVQPLAVRHDRQLLLTLEPYYSMDSMCLKPFFNSKTKNRDNDGVRAFFHSQTVSSQLEHLAD